MITSKWRCKTQKNKFLVQQATQSKLIFQGGNLLATISTSQKNWWKYWVEEVPPESAKRHAISSSGQILSKGFDNPMQVILSNGFDKTETSARFYSARWGSSYKRQSAKWGSSYKYARTTWQDRGNMEQVTDPMKDTCHHQLGGWWRVGYFVFL